MSRCAFVLLAMLALPHAIDAEEAPLTNADVVRMTAAGLESETIIAKIRASRTAFRTDTGSLVALASQQVDDAVIRAMIEKGGAQAILPVRTGKVVQSPRGKRFDDLSVLSKYGGHCDHAQLEVHAKGIRTTQCHESDIDVGWTAIENVCYVYGFRGTLVLRRSEGEERRISTTTPAELKSVRDAIRSFSPRTREVTGCR